MNHTVIISWCDNKVKGNFCDKIQSTEITYSLLLFQVPVCSYSSYEDAHLSLFLPGPSPPGVRREGEVHSNPYRELLHLWHGGGCWLCDSAGVRLHRLLPVPQSGQRWDQLVARPDRHLHRRVSGIVMSWLELNLVIC